MTNPKETPSTGHFSDADRLWVLRSRVERETAQIVR